jgi:predicted glycosyltransferase
MKVKELIKELQKFEPEAIFFVSSDEELNTIYHKYQVATLENKSQVVIYGLSGSELEPTY